MKAKVLPGILFMMGSSQQMKFLDMPEDVVDTVVQMNQESDEAIQQISDDQQNLQLDQKQQEAPVDTDDLELCENVDLGDPIEEYQNGTPEKTEVQKKQ